MGHSLRHIIWAETASAGENSTLSNGSDHIRGPFNRRPTTEDFYASHGFQGFGQQHPPLDKRHQMNQPRFDMFRSTALDFCSIKTPQTSKKNYFENRGYNCGYRANKHIPFLFGFSLLDACFEDRRGHHLSTS